MSRPSRTTVTGFEEIVGSDPSVWEIQTSGAGPQGRLPLTAEMLLESPSGDIFGLTQNAGMGWDPRELGRPQFLMLSTQGGIRDTRLWAALQQAGGGAWGGSVYDVDAIVAAFKTGSR